MSEKELYEQIANKTGESVETIHRLGFAPLTKMIPIEERQRPLIIDWDVEQQFRYLRR